MSDSLRALQTLKRCCSKTPILQLVAKGKQELLKFHIFIAARSIFTGRVYDVTVVKIFNFKI